MDRIAIEDLEVHYCVGVPEAERATPQRLLISVAMCLDFRAAVAADDLSKTVDYFAVSRRLLNFGNGRSWRLIETLASEIADMILEDGGPRRVEVEVKKFIIAEARYVSVRVNRGQGTESAGG